MSKSSKSDIDIINPNWSAFVLLVTLLAVFNSLVTLLPLPADARSVLVTINLSVSVILWADFAYLLKNSPDKRRFMIEQRGWMVLLGSMPLFRFFRILWFRWILKKNGRSIREFLSLIVINKNAEGTLLSILFTVIVIFESAVVFILYFEEAAPDGNITSVPDAFWWAFVTVATVGYGDKYPVTMGGRVVAILLMAVGIALFSVITGSLVEWFRSRQVDAPAQTEKGAATTSPEQAVAEIKHLLDVQESTYQQTITELKARLTELESSLELRE